MHLDSTNSNLNRFISPNVDINGVVVISHGMAEHIGRYEWLISQLNSDGYHVIARDHRGHGTFIVNGYQPGFFSETDGWIKVSNDLRDTVNAAITEFPELDCYLFAHSMGSWIALSILNKQINIKAIVLSGSSKVSNFMIYFQKVLVKFEILRNGKKAVSQIIDRFTIRSFNNKFKPIRTSNDWISSDNTSVDNYTNDPLCGFMVTNSLWSDLCNGLQMISNLKYYSYKNLNIPIYIISGELDSSSSYGKMTKNLYKFLSRRFKNIKIEIIDKARHEVFSEWNKNESYRKLINFLQCS